MLGIHRARILLFLLVISVIGIRFSQPVNAQFKVIGQPAHIEMSTDINVFLRYDSRETVSGILLDLPVKWDVLAATQRSVKGEYSRFEVAKYGAGKVEVKSTTPIKFGTIVWLRLRPSAASLINRIEFTPTKTAIPKNSSSADVGVRSGSPSRSLTGQKKTLELTSSRATPILSANKTAKFNGIPNGDKRLPTDDRPIVMLPESAQLTFASPYTLSAWVKTSAVNTVVLSTWTGAPDDDYAFEWVIDPTGFLEFYRGFGSRHVSMRSQKPVADGNWHFLSLMFDPAEDWSRLAVDGVVEDSLYHAISFPTTTVTKLGLGRRLGPTSQSDVSDFVGEMDDVRISARAWKPAIIQAEMQHPVIGKDFILNFEKPTIAGLQTGRSNLRIGNPISIVVSFEQQKVFLEWKVDDTAIQKFRIERSFDGIRFTTAGSVLAQSAFTSGSYTFSEEVSGKDVVYYRIIPILNSGVGGASPVVKVGLGNEKESVTAKLDSNFPNPFNPTTTIRYEVYATQHIRISVWDLSGQMVASLVDGVQTEGGYEVYFNASELPSGTYFARLVADSGVQTHQMLLMK